MHIGAFSWANSLPLVADLELKKGSDDRITWTTPAGAASLLKFGQVDVALAPATLLFSDGRFQICGRGCVACRGAVESAGILLRRPLPEVRRVALDNEATVSSVLTRLLLMKRDDVTCEYVPWRSRAERMPRQVDGVLAIGETCLRLRSHAGFQGFFDLGRAWWEHSGTPMLFALWIAKDADIAARAAPILAAARESAMSRLEELALEVARRTDLPLAESHRYLSRTIRYKIDDEMRVGLTMFAEEAEELGLLQVDNWSWAG